MDRTTRSVISIPIGFAVALLLLYMLVRFVGVDDVILVLRSAQPTVVGAAFLLSLCWMATWRYTLSLVFGVLNVPTTPWHSFLVYLNVIFANNIAPFSVDGGELSLRYSSHEHRERIMRRRFPPFWERTC